MHENMVAMGENAWGKQFHFLQQCLQKWSGARCKSQWYKKIINLYQKTKCRLIQIESICKIEFE